MFCWENFTIFYLDNTERAVETPFKHVLKIIHLTVRLLLTTCVSEYFRVAVSLFRLPFTFCKTCGWLKSSTGDELTETSEEST